MDNNTPLNQASCPELAQALTEALELSNGLEFISLLERLALIRLLSEDARYILDESN